MAIEDYNLAETEQDRAFIGAVYAKYLTGAELAQKYTPVYIAAKFTDQRLPHSFMPAAILRQTVGFSQCRAGLNPEDIATAYENAVRADATGMGTQTGYVGASRSGTILKALEKDRRLSRDLGPEHVHEAFYIALQNGNAMQAAIRMESSLGSARHRAAFSYRDVALAATSANEISSHAALLHVLKITGAFPELREGLPAAVIGHRFHDCIIRHARVKQDDSNDTRHLDLADAYLINTIGDARLQSYIRKQDVEDLQHYRREVFDQANEPGMARILAQGKKTATDLALIAPADTDRLARLRVSFKMQADGEDYFARQEAEKCLHIIARYPGQDAPAVTCF